MIETDNCPVCKTPCGLVVEKDKFEIEIAYAICKICKTRWRRRDDPKKDGRLIYEKWICRIPEMNIPFPFVGGGIKLRSRWCRWIKIKEKYVPVGYESAKDKPRRIGTQGEPFDPFDQRVQLRAKESKYYEFKLSKGDKIKGKILADNPVNVWFLDEKNFDRFIKYKRFQHENATAGAYETNIDFEATKKDWWYVVVENPNKIPREVKIYLYSQFIR